MMPISQFEELKLLIADTVKQSEHRLRAVIAVDMNAAINTSADGLRMEIHDAFSKLTGQISELRAETQSSISDLRTELQIEMRDGFAGIAEAISDINDRHEVTNIRVTGLDKRVTKLEHKTV